MPKPIREPNGPPNHPPPRATNWLSLRNRFKGVSANHFEPIQKEIDANNENIYVFASQALFAFFGLELGRCRGTRTLGQFLDPLLYFSRIFIEPLAVDRKLDLGSIRLRVRTEMKPSSYRPNEGE